MIYNVVLISGVQQSESVIHIHISILFQILFPYRCKNPQQILINRIKQHIKKIIHHDQVGSIPGMKEFFNIHKVISVIHHIKKLKGKKKNVIISEEAEKLLTKFNTPL